MPGSPPRSVAGRAGYPPGQLMMASVLQFSENLAPQAADVVRDRMTWKCAPPELEDAGFDASVLSEFGPGWWPVA